MSSAQLGGSCVEMGSCMRSHRQHNMVGLGSNATYRYRDKWNRTVVRRVAKTHNHAIKIKGKVRARGARGQQWYSDAKVQFVRKKAHTQNLWNLQLAGDWRPSLETVQRPFRTRANRPRTGQLRL